MYDKGTPAYDAAIRAIDTLRDPGVREAARGHLEQAYAELPTTEADAWAGALAQGIRAGTGNSHRLRGGIESVLKGFERSVNEQPMTTLAATALVGFVLGALMKK
jgi:hypothetical protein